MAEHVVRESEDPELTLEELKAEQETLREKAVRKQLESLWWGAVIIWAGVVLIADYIGLLPEIREVGPWSWIFLGAGALGLIGALVRAASATLPKPTSGDYFWSAVFLIVGSSGFLGWEISFPIALVVIGLAILANVIFRRD